MEKTYILGNNAQPFWAEKIADAEYIRVQPLNINNHEEIHDYVVHTFGESELGKIVFDLQEGDAGIFMAIAMHIRLTYEYLREKSFVPILFVSDLDLTTYLNAAVYSPYCQMFMTQKVWYCNTEEIATQVTHTSAFSSFADFSNGFLKLITIKPDAKIGKHSLANQWGASVLHRTLFADKLPEIKSFEEVKTKLFFKYVTLQSMPNYNSKVDTDITCDAAKKKILLIDDEADKGWNYVLGKMFPDADFRVINEKVPNYESLSDASKQLIERNEFDLFLLDLRMNGDIEDDQMVKPEDFSGMDILRKIKALNKGNQVIMLTASNKAWNMKALLDAGADGYYIKESPEYAFPFDYSKNNTKELMQTIERCLFVSRNQRSIWDSITTIKSVMDSNSLANKYFVGFDVMHGLKYQTLISTELDVIWELIRSSQEKRYELAMLSLFKMLEFMCEFFYKLDRSGRICFIDCDYKELMFWDSGRWYKKGEKAPIYSKREIGNSITRKDLESTTTKIHNIMKYIHINDNDISYDQIKNLGKERNAYIHAKNSATRLKEISLQNVNTWINAIETVCSNL